MEEKSTLRSEMRASRLNLTEEEFIEKSKAIANVIMELPQYKEAERIMVYLPLEGEVNIKHLFGPAWEAGKELYVPVCEGQEPGVMQAALYKKKSITTITKQKVMEPVFARYIDPEDLDLLLIPGLAFDKQGHRLGYGGGYYDRFFHRLNKKAVKIGITFDLQVFDEIPYETHDQFLDGLITESGFYSTSI